MENFTSIPADIRDWAAVNLIVALPSQRVLTVIDGRKILDAKEPLPKPPGGARDEGDKHPDDTNRRETYEEVGIVIREGQSHFVRWRDRRTHFLIGYFTIISDEQLESERRPMGMEGESVDTMLAEEILRAGDHEFVPLYRDFYRSELEMIVAGKITLS